MHRVAAALRHLVYPSCCAACSTPLVQGEKDICMDCLLSLPQTGFHLADFNPLRKLLKGRVAVDEITACYYFDKKLRVQRLMHQIKYHGKQDLAVELGRWYGHSLRSSGRFDGLDAIIPVPLHPAREKVRGFNQSAAFGLGLADALKVQLTPGHLYRKANSSSQTRKSRTERWENVHSIFGLHAPEALRGKSLLLVDDVITTGATLEACAVVLHEAGIASLRIATMACALKI